MTAMTPSRPGLRLALLVGALIALPVLALFFVANALFGLPPLPIKVMDWLPNNLPNALLNAGKEAMVSVLNAISPDNVDGSAKVAEAIIGSATLFMLIVAAVVVIFALARRRGTSDAGQAIGWFVGLTLGVVMTLMYFSLPQVQFERSSYTLIDGLFILAVLGIAGDVAGRLHDRLADLSASENPQQGTDDGMNRRQFIVRVAGTTATLTVTGAVVSLLAGGTDSDTPAASQPQTAPTLAVSQPSTVVTSEEFVPAPGTRPEYTPLEEHYRIDIVGFPPAVEAATWTLPLVGLVNTPRHFTLDELRAMPAQDRIVTMACISNAVAGNLISTTKWTGVPMRDLVALSQPLPEATYLKITCADGFDEYVSLTAIRMDPRIMLTYAWDDQPLLQKHGFPARIHIPDVYGMKQPKWITNIEFVDAWEEGYWVRRGWSPAARIHHTSVIDTVAVDARFEQDGVTYIPVGGIAFAGDRGIRTVEISIDGGAWTPAVLKEPLGDNTWALWRYDWPYQAGGHTFEVRCIDGDGAAQRAEYAPQFPDGATGLHRVSRAV